MSSRIGSNMIAYRGTEGFWWISLSLIHPTIQGNRIKKRLYSRRVDKRSAVHQKTARGADHEFLVDFASAHPPYDLSTMGTPESADRPNGLPQ